MARFARRSGVALVAALIIGSMAFEPAFAQVTGGSTVGPAGGVGSTTAPSNSQGTPAGGTGVLSTTRVGPSGSVPVATPNTAPVAGPRSVSPTPRRLRRPARRRAAETGTQSQAGTNGAAPASR